MTRLSKNGKIELIIDCLLRAAKGDNTAFYDAAVEGDEVDAIGIAFNSLLEEVRSASDEHQKTILAWRRAMHDLRGPISTIPLLIGIVNEARSNSAHEEDQLSETLASIKASCEIMLGKINYALDPRVTQLRGTKKVVLFELMKEVLSLALLRPWCADYEVNNNIPKDLVIFSDRNILQSVFKNLAENAYKYRKPDVPGRLIIEAFRKEKKIIIRFVDNGIGIKAENISRIFQMYTRVPGVGSVDGTGYGLYSVRRDVESLGGDVHLVSVYGEGVTIEICLPISSDENILRFE